MAQQMKKIYESRKLRVWNDRGTILIQAKKSGATVFANSHQGVLSIMTYPVHHLIGMRSDVKMFASDFMSSMTVKYTKKEVTNAQTK